MCGIMGFVKLAGLGRRMPIDRRFVDYLNQIACRIGARGPDYFGVWGRDDYENTYSKRIRINELVSWDGPFNNFFKYVPEPTICMMQFRGTPVTESARSELDYIAQPFVVGDVMGGSEIVVTHNGQLSNDAHIWEKYGMSSLRTMQHEAPVDSWAFMPLMEQVPQGQTRRAAWFAKLVYELEGSYAFAGYDARSSFLYFAKTYRGLAFAVWKSESDVYLVWASDKAALDNRPVSVAHNAELAIAELPDHFVTGVITRPNSDRAISGTSAYSILRNIIMRGTYLEERHIDVRGKIRSEYNRSSALVILSGGLDSAVALYDVAQTFNSLHVLHFNYGQRAYVREAAACELLLRDLHEKHPSVSIQYQHVSLDWFRRIGGSSLTDPDQTVATGEIAQEEATEWVPARNTVLMSLAASYCDRHDVGNIVLGLNMEEASVYSDNSNEFYDRMGEALRYGTKSRPNILMPVGNMMKHAIAKRAVELEVPLEHVWSCYKGTNVHCGECGSCRNRRAAFLRAGFTDVIEYESDVSLSVDFTEE